MFFTFKVNFSEKLVRSLKQGKIKILAKKEFSKP